MNTARVVGAILCTKVRVPLCKKKREDSHPFSRIMVDGVTAYANEIYFKDTAYPLCPNRITVSYRRGEWWGGRKQQVCVWVSDGWVRL